MTSKLDHTVFKLKRYSSFTLHVRPKKQIAELKKKINSTKIQILPQKIGHDTIEPTGS